MVNTRKLTKQLRLYAVTDSNIKTEKRFLESIEESLKAGVTILQLREKNIDTDEFIYLAEEVKDICRKYDVPFIINDSLEVAIASKADGIHIGQGDMALSLVKEQIGEGKIVGVSCQTVEQALVAERDGADYIGVGAVFNTSTKLDAKTISHDTLKAICQAVKIPVVAIGGINESNINELAGSLINGVAVVSAIYGADSITKATASLYMLAGKVCDTGLRNVLTIAGSDCSGGAGIQADIKAITAHRHYAMSAITALTAQNTTGVYGISEVSPEFVASQLDCIFKDIKPDSIKIGMVSSPEIIKVIVDKLIEYKATNIVVDPVMVSTSGSKLLSDEAMENLINLLLPLGTIITPNLKEAEVLCKFSINSKEDMIKAAEAISKLVNGAVLVKGGHLASTADDLLYNNGEVSWITGDRVNNDNTHGTGCTLSSAIACRLAEDRSLLEAVTLGKAYITGALKDNLNLGSGSGPLNHTFCL